MSDTTYISSAAAGGGARIALFLEALVGLGVVAALLGRHYGPFPTLLFLFASVAVGFTGWMVARMFGSLGDPSLDVVGRVRNFEREKLEGEKALLLKGIKDLEIDFATRKMSEADYQRMRETAEARAVSIIRALRETDDRYRQAAERMVSEHLGVERPESPTLDIRKGANQVAASLKTGTQPFAVAAIFAREPARLLPVDGGVRCEACETVSPAEARFCIGCGRPREEVTP